MFALTYFTFFRSDSNYLTGDTHHRDSASDFEVDGFFGASDSSV